ncbi:MAG TPA: hypothetical protein PKK23_02600 [Nitrospirales bacterium]|nr:hypothetical protein [Nitrospiraceae bacterium]HNP27907.1 hypothetical protein [Nitrospirales bacterium]
MKKHSGNHPLSVNQKELSKLLGVSVSTLATWDLPCEKVGRESRYDAAQCVALVLQRERERTGSLEEEQVKLVQVRRQRQEIQLEVESGKYFPLADGIKLVTSWGMEIKGHLEAMDERLPTWLAKETDHRKIKARLKKEHADVLSMFAKMKFE